MKLRVTKRGCFGRIDGAVAELPIGHEFKVKDIPPAFVGCVIVIEDIKITPPETLLILKIEDKDVDLSKLTVDGLKEFVEANNLDVTQEKGEVKADFAKRIYSVALAKLGE
ncbi:hypothetical protein A9G41_11985 [Gilliamella sp. Nev5-1]|uniref:hypothetical protein n=1 Tax=unclassified Gilliamella TaxID=2685620 RepID=UPI00080DA5B4|nr:hypothetical protein [Gilliamella apicola]OCG59779.1 hypothetical protein A9G40_06075 [Gilliamella apicola]OCG66807.1 hypothetical protein A9G41_11985 [Gilliamella apicola]